MFHVDISQEDIEEEALAEDGKVQLKCDFCLQLTTESTNLCCEQVLHKNCLHNFNISSGDTIECCLCLKSSTPSAEPAGDASQKAEKDQPDLAPVPLPRKTKHVNLGTTNTLNQSIPGKSIRNLVQHFTALQDLKTTYGLSTKLKWDFEKCIYWGMCVCPSGDVILADWVNERVKVYDLKDGYKSSADIQQPLDVLYLGKGLIVVSHGGKMSSVTYIGFTDGTLKNQRTVQASLYCFNMTMYTKKKVGVALAEREDGSPTLALIKPTNKVKELDIDSARFGLVTQGGILYHSMADRLYTTAGAKLICIDIEQATTEFTQTYAKGGTNSYFELGYMTSFSARNIFIASERSVLCVTTKGDFLRVIEALLDPYTIATTPDNSIIIVGGRSSMLEVLDLNKDH